MEQLYHKEARKEQQFKEDLEHFQNLSLMDDDFMRLVLHNNIPLAQFILQIILQKPGLVVTKVETQADMKRLVGIRSITMDAYVEDDKDKRYNIEVQKDSSEAIPERARYHSVILDSTGLMVSEEFDKLRESFVIFITEKDIYRLGEALYPIERVNLRTGKLFGDGAHILFVNGSYRGDSPIGWLMHDFCSPDPEKMHYSLFAEAVGYFKHTRKGQEDMSAYMDKIRSEERERGKEEGKIEEKKETALKMHNQGYPDNEVASIFETDIETIRKWIYEKSPAL